MSTPKPIPTNFRIPKDCRHEWLLFVGPIRGASIRPVPGKKRLLYTVFEDVIPMSEKEARVIQSRSLDWIAESIEHLRALCSGEIDAG